MLMRCGTFSSSEESHLRKLSRKGSVMERFNLYIREWGDLQAIGRFSFVGVGEKEVEFKSRGMVDVEGRDRATGTVVPLTIWKSDR